MNPLDGEAHFHLALVYGRSEKYIEAIRHYDRAQELRHTGDPKLGKLLEPYRIKEYNLEYKPLLDRKHERAVIKIRGNPLGDKIVMRDVIQLLESLEHVSKKGIFEKIDIEFIRWEGNKTWFEKWTVKGKNTENDCQIKFILCSDGGTDIQISGMKKVKEKEEWWRRKGRLE